MRALLTLDPTRPGSDLSFAVSCAIGGMIDMAALHDWIYAAIAQHEGDDLPPCIFDILDKTEQRDLSRADAPGMKHLHGDPWMTSARLDALIGLGHQLAPTSAGLANISDARAARALQNHPEVTDRFEALFFQTSVLSKEAV